ncbi:MAG: hypothetical protein ABIU20_10580 [Blastocatellia bacterium]
MNVQELETVTLEPTIDPLLQLLIDQQGVEPITDLNKLSALWPTNDDPDELLAFILTERNERRLVTLQKDDDR